MTLHTHIYSPIAFKPCNYYSKVSCALESGFFPFPFHFCFPKQVCERRPSVDALTHLDTADFTWLVRTVVLSLRTPQLGGRKCPCVVGVGGYFQSHKCLHHFTEGAVDGETGPWVLGAPPTAPGAAGGVGFHRLWSPRTLWPTWWGAGANVPFMRLIVIKCEWTSGGGGGQRRHTHTKSFLSKGQL